MEQNKCNFSAISLELQVSAVSSKALIPLRNYLHNYSACIWQQIVTYLYKILLTILDKD